jgi:multidrug resistance efflux pump
MNPNLSTKSSSSATDTPGRSGHPSLGFRMEAMHRHSSHAQGKTTLAVPIPFAWYSAAALSLIAMIVAFLAFGSYTTTEIKDAVIVTDAGLVRIKGRREGTIAKLYVREGDRVRAEAPLIGLRIEGQNFDQADSSEGTVSAEPENTPKLESKIVDIKSPVDGVVYQLPMSVGSAYNPYLDAAVVAPAGNLSVTTQVSAAAQSRLRVGDKITLVLDAFKGRPNANISGHITSIALSPTEIYVREARTFLRTYRVDIKIDLGSTSHSRQALLGKTVTIKIPVQKRKMYQWLFDPLKALFGGD